MTGWQDSFQPVQSQLQGWQGSFQPDSPGIMDKLAAPIDIASKGGAQLISNMIAPFLSDSNVQKLTDSGMYNVQHPEIQNPFVRGVAESPLGAYNQAIYGAIAAPVAPIVQGAEDLAKKAGVSQNALDIINMGGSILGMAGPGDIKTNISIPETMANNSKNFISNNAGAAIGPKIPISPDIQSTLLNGSPDVRTYLGEDLGQKLSGAEQNAYTNKTLAYKAAEQPSKDLSIGNNSVGDLADALKDSTANFNPRVVNNVGGIHDAADALTKDAASGDVSWQRIDQVRQELYNLPKANDAEAAVRARALSAYHNYADDVFNNGIVQGDPAAINLVKDANQANATWRQQFTGKDANNAISKYIKNAGGPEEIAPENLLDMFTRVGQIGLDNVKAAKDVLGTDASPILKQGYLDKLRSTSLDQNGEFVPAKLQKNINTLLTKNPTLVNSVFTPEELQGLQGISDTAGRYAKTGAKPGVLGRVTLKIPIAKQLFGPSIEAAAKTRMMNDIATPRAQ